jgi:hypothetical protein
VLQKVLPELNRGSLFIEVEGHPKDTVEEAAARLVGVDQWASESGRLMELNPRYKESTDLIGPQPLRAIRTPPLWSERRLMANLHRLIRSGDRQAVEYFFRWCGTVGPKTLDRFQYYIRDCLEALAAQKNLWSVPADLQASEVAERQFLACCLRYLRDDGKASQELLAHMADKAEAVSALAVDCFSIRSDATAKEPILKHLEAGGRYNFWMNHRVNKYLERIATSADLPRIEAIAMQRGGFERKDIEEILIKIRLQELLKPSLTGKAKATSP